MDLGGFIPPIATPMRQGSIDYDSLESLVDFLHDSVAGYLIGGSVGEHPSLTLEERAALISAVARRRKPGRSLVVNVADNALENCRRMIRVAEEVGADLLMVSCPNYFANTLPMLLAYFKALSSYSTLPLCLYDNPIASHTALSIAEIEALAHAVPSLRAVKVTDPISEKVRALRERTDLVVHAGDDFVLWHMLTRGAHGGMVALPMIYPEAAHTVWNAAARGDWDAAEAAYRTTSHFIHVGLGAPDYVAVIKAVLFHRGVIATPEVRLPLLSLSEQRQDEVLRALYPGT